MAKKNYKFTGIDTGNSFPTGICTHVDWEPRTNIIETQDNEMLIIEVELPGVIKDDISIVLENTNHLVIRGIKRQPNLGDSNRLTYVLFEREFGSFYKRIALQFQVDESNIQSFMDNGVLTVKIPRKKTEKISVEIK
jgi:HSP20 family protein